MFRYPFSAKKNKVDKVDHRLNHVYLTLHQSHRNREFLEVTLPNDDRVYQSMLLEIDPDEGTMLIDELFPSDFVGMPGQDIHCTLRQTNGRHIQFDTQISERHQYDGSPIYVVALPAELDFDQRRASYRLPLSSLAPVESWFLAPNQQEHSARLKDLSIHGVCLEVEESAEGLSVGDSLREVSFEFAGVPILCNLRVKNVQTGSRNSQRVGAQFVNLSAAEQRRLEQAIIQEQREYLRQEGWGNERLAG
ncbi:flagellar brake protein [Aurantivibrio plasticivorans]